MCLWQELEEHNSHQCGALLELRDDCDGGDQESRCQLACNRDKTIQACEQLAQQVKKSLEELWWCLQEEEESVTSCSSSFTEPLGEGEAASDAADVGRCVRAAEHLDAEHSQNFPDLQASTQQPAALAAGSQGSPPAAAGKSRRTPQSAVDSPLKLNPASRWRSVSFSTAGKMQKFCVDQITLQNNSQL